MPLFNEDKSKALYPICYLSILFFSNCSLFSANLQHLCQDPATLNICGASQSLPRKFVSKITMPTVMVAVIDIFFFFYKKSN